MKNIDFIEEEKHTFPNNKKEIDKMIFSCDVAMFICAVMFFCGIAFLSYALVNWFISCGYLKG